MAEAWPASLPTKPLQEGFRYDPPDASIESEVDVGLPKVRKRYTIGVETFTIPIRLTSTSDVTTLNNHFYTTLESGTKETNYRHPILGTTQAFKMRKPTITSDGSNFRAVFELYRKV